MPAGTGCEPGERAAMPTTARNTRLPSCGGRSIVGKKKKKTGRIEVVGAEEIGSCSWASAADNRVATRDASRRQQTPASSVCNMPDNAIGCDTGGLGEWNRHEWRCEVDRLEVQFPLPPAWVCRRRQTADGAKLGRPNRGTSTDNNRRTWRKKIKVQQLALPRCHGGATRAPE